MATRAQESPEGPGRTPKVVQKSPGEPRRGPGEPRRAQEGPGEAQESPGEPKRGPGDPRRAQEWPRTAKLQTVNKKRCQKACVCAYARSITTQPVHTATNSKQEEVPKSLHVRMRARSITARPVPLATNGRCRKHHTCACARAPISTQLLKRPNN